MKTLNKIAKLDIQVKAVIITAIILTATFTTMLLTHGFRTF